MTQGIKQPGGLTRYLPILSWLPNYQRGWLRGDLIAGLVVLTLLAPEGMAYAQMAGLPPKTDETEGSRRSRLLTLSRLEGSMGARHDKLNPRSNRNSLEERSASPG